MASVVGDMGQPLEHGLGTEDETDTSTDEPVIVEETKTDYAAATENATA